MPERKRQHSLKSTNVPNYRPLLHASRRDHNHSRDIVVVVQVCHSWLVLDHNNRLVGLVVALHTLVVAVVDRGLKVARKGLRVVAVVVDSLVAVVGLVAVKMGYRSLEFRVVGVVSRLLVVAVVA